MFGFKIDDPKKATKGATERIAGRAGVQRRGPAVCSASTSHRGSAALRAECSVRRVRRVRRVAFVGCPVAPQARHAAAEGARCERCSARCSERWSGVGATVQDRRCHSSCRMTSCSCLDSESPRRGMIIRLVEDFELIRRELQTFEAEHLEAQLAWYSYEVGVLCVMKFTPDTDVHTLCVNSRISHFHTPSLCFS